MSFSKHRCEQELLEVVRCGQSRATGWAATLHQAQPEQPKPQNADAARMALATSA